MTKSGVDERLAGAVTELRRGGTIAFPTETYYALGADALDEAALERLLSLKGRSAEKTLSLLIEPEWLETLVAEIPPLAHALMDAHWPGPLTLALPARKDLPAALVLEGCVAVRVSPHPLARALVQAFGGPVTATSANPAGQPPPSTAAAVHGYFPTLFVLGEEDTPGGLPSTLARITRHGMEVLRPGPVSLKATP